MSEAILEMQHIAKAFSGIYALKDAQLTLHKGSVMALVGENGAGKSTLMRRVGARMEEEGLDTEYILCSGDPDSLDALLLPQLGVALVDGTAPHAAAPLGHPAKKVSICKGLRGRK